MSRSLPEWVGDNDDQDVPQRVRVRVFDEHDSRCHRCGRKIGAGERWTLEHIKALINGGGNRESNLAISCDWCLPEKNAEDMDEKSKVYAIRSKHLGMKPKSRWSNSFRKSRT